MLGPVVKNAFDPDGPAIQKDNPRGMGAQTSQPGAELEDPCKILVGIGNVRTTQLLLELLRQRTQRNSAKCTNPRPKAG